MLCSCWNAVISFIRKKYFLQNNEEWTFNLFIILMTNRTESEVENIYNNKQKNRVNLFDRPTRIKLACLWFENLRDLSFSFLQASSKSIQFPCKVKKLSFKTLSTLTKQILWLVIKNLNHMKNTENRYTSDATTTIQEFNLFFYSDSVKIVSIKI